MNDNVIQFPDVSPASLLPGEGTFELKIGGTTYVHEHRGIHVPYDKPFRVYAELRVLWNLLDINRIFNLAVIALSLSS